MKKNIITAVAVLLSLCIGDACAQNKPLNLIPQPAEVNYMRGSFTLNTNTRLYTNLKGDARQNLVVLLEDSPFELPLIKKQRKENIVRFLLVKPSASLPSDESYNLSISASGITVAACAEVGLFYGAQTLFQLVPEALAEEPIDAIEITDTPRFEYRGFHLDVSRHFRSKEFVKKQLDAMARYKLNRFHWHLTDAAGWRLEIKKYPLLTEVAAWRPYKTWKEWWSGDRQYCTEDDPNAHGGYYTQEDIKEILAYAEARHITVIPEIEMPGHSEEVLAVYPELSCAGKPYVNSDFCIGNEQTFTFLEDVLTEVMELFPSQYIHIGGDEAGKGGWKTCLKCKERMETENLKNVDELQSYLIHRIEVFLNENGRKLLGWDEIMEGGLAPDATVMSWRGEQGGIDAAKAGHNVIMTPGAYCYIDHSQDDPTSEPESIGGYLPLKKVYSYNPIPESLTPEQQKLIQGVQANLWTEYIDTPEYAEYMIYPRLLALAEVAWTPLNRKSWSDFHRRALIEVEELERRGYHPFPLAKEKGERKEALQPVENIAIGKSITYNTPYSPQYPAGGDQALINGVRGGWTYSDQCWQGFLGKGLDVTIDLGEIRPIQSISADWMQLIGPEVWVPEYVEIEISDDGNTFTKLSRIDNELSAKYDKLAFRTFGWKGSAQARYVRYIARIDQKHKGFIFTDEIVIQ